MVWAPGAVFVDAGSLPSSQTDVLSSDPDNIGSAGAFRGVGQSDRSLDLGINIGTETRREHPGRRTPYPR